MDGSHHYHCLLIFVKAPDFRSVRCFDLMLNGRQYHPNIRKVGAAVKDHQCAAEYCMKDDPAYLTLNFDFIRNSANFTKIWNDHVAWKAHLARRRLKDVTWPLKFPSHLGWRDAYNLGKRRHIWITGRPDCGKTLMINQMFDGLRRYLRPAASKYPFDSYMQEEVIIYDDTYPPFTEAVAVSNNYSAETPIVGDQRYHQKTWMAYQQRVMIVLSNLPLRACYNSSDLPGMLARFKRYTVPDNVMLVEVPEGDQEEEQSRDPAEDQDDEVQPLF